MNHSQHPATGSSFTRRQHRAHTETQTKTHETGHRDDYETQGKDVITITTISAPVISIISIKYIHKRRQANQTDMVAWLGR